MTVCKQTTRVYEDNLISRWVCPCHGMRSQAHRLSKTVNIPTWAVKTYSKHGMIALVKALRDSGMQLAAAHAQAKLWRGHGAWRRVK